MPVGGLPPTERTLVTSENSFHDQEAPRCLGGAIETRLESSGPKTPQTAEVVPPPRSSSMLGNGWGILSVVALASGRASVSIFGLWLEAGGDVGVEEDDEAYDAGQQHAVL
jgi:hypothetical protein